MFPHQVVEKEAALFLRFKDKNSELTEEQSCLQFEDLKLNKKTYNLTKQCGDVEDLIERIDQLMTIHEKRQRKHLNLIEAIIKDIVSEKPTNDSSR
jgi:DNA-binding SARP family transcriptional activator